MENGGYSAIIGKLFFAIYNEISIVYGWTFPEIDDTDAIDAYRAYKSAKERQTAEIWRNAQAMAVVSALGGKEFYRYITGLTRTPESRRNERLRTHNRLSQWKNRG